MQPVHRGDVIVVGAGLSGLVAARALERAGLDVLVVEASDHVGGKMLTTDIDGDAFDIGAHWIGPTQHRIAGLVAELGVRTRPQTFAGRGVLEVRGRLRHFRGSVPLLPGKVAADVMSAAARLRMMRRGVNFDTLPDAGRPRCLDQQNGQWLRDKVFHTEAGRELFEMTTGLLLGAACSEVAAFYLLAFLRSGKGLRRLSSFRGGAQQDALIGGTQQLCTALAGQLSNPVYLNTPALAVEQMKDTVVVRTTSISLKARRVILAIAPPQAAGLVFTPPLPAERKTAMQAMQMGAYTKFVVQYQRPWWRQQGLSGLAFSPAGPLQMVVEDTHGGGPGTLVGFATGPSARRLAVLSSPARQAAVLDALAHLLGSQAQNPTAFIEHAWAQDPWAGGAPVAFTPPGVLSQTTRPLSQPHGLIHWAGTDLARRYRGGMDGAVESGLRAATEIISSQSTVDPPTPTDEPIPPAQRAQPGGG
jgi:monoamine oxidase